MSPGEWGCGQCVLATAGVTVHHPSFFRYMAERLRVPKKVGLGVANIVVHLSERRKTIKIKIVYYGEREYGDL